MQVTTRRLAVAGIAVSVLLAVVPARAQQFTMKLSQPTINDVTYEYFKRMTAGILALFLGVFGVHKFYLGYTGAGVLQLVLTFFTCGAAKVIPIIEGIIYLTKTDEEFIETYQIGEKEWF